MLHKHPMIHKPNVGDPVNYYCDRCDDGWETGCILSSNGD